MFCRPKAAAPHRTNRTNRTREATLKVAGGLPTAASGR